MATELHGPPLDEPGFHMHDDQGPRINAAMIALIVLSLSFTFARLLSRRLAHAGYWVCTAVFHRLISTSTRANSPSTTVG